LEREFEALKLKIAEIAQKKGELENSVRYLQTDYEKQIDGQAHDIALLQNDLENLKKVNADLGQEGNNVNSDIMRKQCSTSAKSKSRGARLTSAEVATRLDTLTMASRRPVDTSRITTPQRSNSTRKYTS